ncbi:MAG: flagellar filament capping protein FliD [Nitrospinae bacterium]|nr:flagellar filament capping protein FliD [Nitrospinota bacterium]
MATSGLSGITSGFDSATVVQQLVALEKRPIELIQAKRDIEAQKLSTFQELKSRLQTFKSVVTSINTESRFLATKGTFNNNSASALTKVVDITTTSTATSGTFSFTVNSLAKEGKVVSEGFAATDSAIPTGTLTITVGSKVTTVTINSSNNTVDGLRLAINNSGANVSATFLDNGDASKPIQLLISGTKTGAANAVSISLTQASLGGGPLNVVQFTQTQAAQDARLTVDGISVTKSSNTVTDVLPGTILSLQGSGSGTITLSSDTNTIKTQINSFVTGYNDMMAYLNEQLAIDVAANTTGTLFGNFTTQNIQQTLRNNISGQVAGLSGDFQYLSQIGITTQSDGTLTIDDGKLSDALATDIGNVTRLFASKGTTTNANVTFVGFTEKTVAGTYDARISGGAVQLSPSGKNDYVSATGTGNFFAGAAGTDAEGLNFRIAATADGSYGTINLTVGVAETLNRALANLTDTSRGGPLAAEFDSATDTIDDYDDQILKLEQRVQQVEENLKAKFANLDTLLSRLNSQKAAFTSALEGVKNTSPSSS